MKSHYVKTLEKMKPIQKVHFVFIGDDLPNYVIPSLKLASRHSGLDVVLLANTRIKKKLIGQQVNVIPIEDFYSNQEFLVSAKRLSSPASFRSGFWLRTLERFFVLEQYMNAENLDYIFHAELDQLLFRTDELLSSLRTFPNKGIFFPLHTENMAVASVLYCNSKEALRSLIEFSQNCDMFSNEMELLANWAGRNPGKAHILPTMADNLIPNPKQINGTSHVLAASEIGGVVDAAQIGMWIGGLDPRNDKLAKLSLTKFVDAPSPQLLDQSELVKLQFNFSSDESFLTVTHPSIGSAKLYNLHLHSKIHGWLDKNNRRIKKFFRSANHGKIPFISSVITLKVSLFVSSAIPYILKNPNRLWRSIGRRLNRGLNRRPSSAPYLSGDTFRSIAQFVWEDSLSAFNPNDLEPGSVVFCQSDLLPQFSDGVLSKTTTPIVLILGNSDKNFSTKDSKHLDFESLGWGMAQNMSAPIKNLEPLPIGLENAWLMTNGVQSDFNFLRKTSKVRNSRIMWTFTIGTNKEERKSAAESLIQCRFADGLGALTQKEHHSAMTTYSFVASPPGNGMDTHRTWEAMYLGCIPIVIRSFMTEYYENLGLPVWLIDSYEELVRLDQSEIKLKYLELSKQLDHPALWSPYWIERVASKSRELKDLHRKLDTTNL